MSFQISARIYLFPLVVTFNHSFSYAGFFTVSFVSVLLQFNLWSQKTKICANNIEIKYCTSVPVGLQLTIWIMQKQLSVNMFFLILYNTLGIKLKGKEQWRTLRSATFYSSIFSEKTKKCLSIRNQYSAFQLI